MHNEHKNPFHSKLTKKEKCKMYCLNDCEVCKDRSEFIRAIYMIYLMVAVVLLFVLGLAL